MCISDLKSFQDIKKHHLPAVILFYSPRCPYCVEFHPEYIKMSHNNHGIPFISFNLQFLKQDENERLDIQGIPDIRFINKNGQMKKFKGDRRSENELMKQFQEFTKIQY